ncbi:MAG: glyoxalase/bleomycin resistance/dioxygenase family protein [Methylococcus sp.]
MPGPSRAGVLIYAKDLGKLSRFYNELLNLRVLAADAEHVVAENNDIQLVLHAMPAHLVAKVTIASPPELREEQAIKPFFTIASLAAAKQQAQELGGFVFGPTWEGPGFTVRNACDPEGNIIQLRQSAA